MNKIIITLSKRVFTFGFLLSVVSKCEGQQLKIGDKVPEFNSNMVINHTSGSIALSQIKKKWILLDFWGTGCASCIASFSKVEKLQKKFDKDLQIILVNEQSRDSTIRFFEKKKKIVKPNVPFITGAAQLTRMFPHIAVPYFVLIDENRAVRAFPEVEYVTDYAIQNLITNGKIEFGLNERRRFSRTSPIFYSMDSTDQKNITAYFFITKELKGFIGQGMQRTGSSREKNRFFMLNSSIEEHIKNSFNISGTVSFADSAVVIESSRKDILRRPVSTDKFDEWRTEGLYSIDLQVLPDQVSNLTEILRENITRHFDLEISIEKRKAPCYVLKKKPGADVSYSKGAQPSVITRMEGSDEVYIYTNKPFSDIVDLYQLYFTARLSQKTFVNMTGISGNVDMRINASFFEKFKKRNLIDVNESLAPNGLIVIEEECETEVLVIKDKIKSNGR